MAGRLGVSSSKWWIGHWLCLLASVSKRKCFTSWVLRSWKRTFVLLRIIVGVFATGKVPREGASARGEPQEGGSAAVVEDGVTAVEREARAKIQAAQLQHQVRHRMTETPNRAH